MHALPKHHLTPLLYAFSTQFRRVRAAAATGLPLRNVAEVREYREAAHLARDRPFRIMAARRRLFACHWAGWTPERTSTRWGEVGPKWLGGAP